MNFDFSLTPNRKNTSLNKINKFNPEVAIIIPFYNSGKYINDTIQCVLNQSFPWYEVIIVDDGSTDKVSLNILKEIENLDNRITIFHKKNGGLADSRDFGRSKISKSVKYLLFLDDDDLLESNYLECCYFALETNQTASFAYTNTIGFGEQEYLWDKSFSIETEIKENILVATALIRLNDFDLVNGYGIKEKGVNEDWIFWIKLFTKSKFPVRLNYFGFWYRRKKNGELKASLNNQQLTEELMSKYIPEVDMTIQAKEYPSDDYNWNDVNLVDYTFEVKSKLKYNSRNIIMILPHIVMGGADKFCIDFLKGISPEYKVTLILTNISDNNWLQEIKKYVESYYILPSFLDRKYWNGFIAYLVEKLNCNIIFNTNSLYGYMSLPYIKNRFPDIKILDYIHMEEWYNRNGGYSRDSSSVSSVIDLTLTCNKNSEQILKQYFKRSEDKIETVYIGVDEQHFKNDYNKRIIKQKYEIPSNKKIISYIARIVYQKRPFLLVQIIKKYVENHDDVIFLICGDGDLLSDLKAMITKYNLDEFVKFLGNVKNTKEIYAISDITLNCSIKEGLALTTYESLSMGVPVVSSNVGGQSEIIDHTVGACINTLQCEDDIYDFNYDEKEIDDYIRNIDIIFENLPNYKKNCRGKILNGFTIDQMNKNMNLILDNLYNSKSMKKFENGDVSLELLNQYLLESKEEYLWNCQTLFKSKYNKDILEAINYNHGVKYNIKKVFVKLHIYQEITYFYRFIKYLILGIKSLLMIPINLAKRVFNLLNKGE